MIRDTFAISEISELSDLALFDKRTTSTFETDVRCCLNSFLLIMTPPLNLQMFWNILIEQTSLQTKLLLTEYWDVRYFTFILVCLFEIILIDYHLFFSSGVQVFL